MNPFVSVEDVYQNHIKREEPIATQPSFGPEHPLHIDRHSIHYGVEWWSLNQFIMRLDTACKLPPPGFNFYAYMYHRSNGKGALYTTPGDSRPNEGQGQQLYRFLELFNTLGFFIVWCWKRITLTDGCEDLTLFDIMDNTSLSIKFVQFVDYIYHGAVIDRGVKITVRRQVKDREYEKKKIIDWFQLNRHQFKIKDRDIMNWTHPKVITRAKFDAGKANLWDIKYIENETTQQSTTRIFNANKRLVLKWCVQASHINSSGNQYQLPTLFPPGLAAEIQRGHSPPPGPPHRRRGPPPPLSHVDPGLILDMRGRSPVLVRPRPPNRLQLPADFSEGEQAMRFNSENDADADADDEADDDDEDTDDDVDDSDNSDYEAKGAAYHRVGTGRARGRRRRHRDDDDEKVDPTSLYLRDVTASAQWDVDVKQMYLECIELIIGLGGGRLEDHSTTEKRLLVYSSVTSKVFFAEWVAILTNRRRASRGKTELSKIVMNRMNTDELGLKLYFSTSSW